MRFLARANWRYHRGQYIASGLAVIVCCCFIFASVAASNIISWATATTPENAKTSGVTVTINPYPEETKKQKTNNDGGKDSQVVDLNAENKEADNYNPVLVGTKKLTTFLKENPQYGQVNTDKQGEESILDEAAVFKKLIIDNLATLKSRFGADAVLAWDIHGTASASFNGKDSMVDLQAYDPNVASSARSKPKLGRFPQSSQEITLHQSVLDRIGAKLGDEIQVKYVMGEKDHTINYKVVGVLANDLRSRLGTEANSLIYINPTDENNNPITALSTTLKVIPGEELVGSAPDPYRGYDHDAMVKTAQKVANILNEKGLLFDQTEVSITDTHNSMQNDSRVMLLVFFSAFQLMAVIFCMAVVANTYQVVLARRRRENALLRCLGANVRQLRRAQLWECLFLGLVSATIGTIIALFGAIGLLYFSGEVGTVSEIVSICGIDPILASWIVGVITPVIAGIRPTWRAAKITPVAALNPQVLNQLNAKKRHIFRTTLGCLAIVAGIVLCLQIPRYLKLEMGSEYSILFAISGCFMLTVGLILISLSVLPIVSSWLLKPFAKKSALVDLGRLHIRREPHRTGATATALMMGIILVSTLMIGSESVEKSANQVINRNFPIDAMISTSPQEDNSAALMNQKLKDLSITQKTAAIPGVTVTKIVAANGKEINVANPEHSIAELNNPSQIDNQDWAGKMKEKSLSVAVARAFTSEHASFFNDPDLKYQTEPGQIQMIIQDRTMKDEDLLGPWQVTFNNQYTLKLQPKRVPSANLRNCLPYGDNFLISAMDLEKITKHGEVAAKTSGFLVKMDHDVDLFDLVKEVQELQASVRGDQDSAGLNFGGINLGGGIFMIVAVRVMVNVVLALMLLLIGVCVVISLVGVANTLTLSTVDRSKENALLRTMGFSEKQVKRLVVLEALVIGSGALLVGIVSSMLFAWIGVKSLPLTQDRDLLQLYFPWISMLTVVAVTLGCCYLASILPGRKASKESPIEAMSNSMK